MEAPRRAYILELKLQADDKRAIHSALKHIDFLIASNQLTQGVSGGYDSGYSYKLDVDESITHDNYIEKLEKYLAEKKKQESAH